MFSKRVNFSGETNFFSQIVKRQKEHGQTIIDLTQSNPTEVGFNYNRRRILDALSRSDGLKYKPNPCGLAIARKAISNYYEKIGVEADFNSIYLTASTSESYTLLFKLLGDPYDQILIPSPGYPLLSFLPGFESLKPVIYPQRYDPENGWYLDFDAIEARITPKTRAIALVNPNNPTGVYLKPHELLMIDEICCRNNMALIVDEVFSDYRDESSSKIVRTVVSRCRALTFVLNGFSKMLALPQVKLGWIVVGGEARQAEVAKNRLEMLLDFYLSVSSQVQYAAADLLTLRRNIQYQIKKRILDNHKELNAQLAKTCNFKMLKREGGWYAVVEIEDLWEDEARVVQLLLQDNTLVHPGYFYDFHREGFVVVSLLSDLKHFKKGISRLVKRFGCRVIEKD